MSKGGIRAKGFKEKERLLTLREEIYQLFQQHDPHEGFEKPTYSLCGLAH